jgi:hypothetical protein
VGIGFLTSLYDASAEGIISEDIIRTNFKAVLPDLLENWNIHSIGTISHSFNWNGYAEEIGQHISALLFQCEKWDFSGALGLLITKLVEEAVTANFDYFKYLYMPLVKRLVTELKARGMGARTSPFRKLLQLLLGTYIVEHIGAEPQSWKDWTLPTVPCICQICKPFNEFLSEPSRQECGFQLSPDEMTHFKKNFPRTGLTCTFIKGVTPQVIFCHKAEV